MYPWFQKQTVVNYALTSNSLLGNLFHEAEFMCFFPAKFCLIVNVMSLRLQYRNACQSWFGILMSFGLFFGHFTGIYLLRPCCTACRILVPQSHVSIWVSFSPTWAVIWGKMSQPLGWWIALRLLHKENAGYCPACLLCCLSLHLLAPSVTCSDLVRLNV